MLLMMLLSLYQSTDAQHSAAEQHGVQPARRPSDRQLKTFTNDETTRCQVRHSHLCCH